VITLCTIGCYALSLAPVIWVLISEIFPNLLRGIGVSISVSALEDIGDTGANRILTSREFTGSCAK